MLENLGANKWESVETVGCGQGFVEELRKKYPAVASLVVFCSRSSGSSVIALQICAREYSILFHTVAREIKGEVGTISRLRMKNKSAGLLQQGEFQGSFCARLLKQTAKCTRVFIFLCQKQA